MDGDSRKEGNGTMSEKIDFAPRKNALVLN